MGKSTNQNQTTTHDKGFYLFFGVRIAGAVVLAIALIWGSMKLIDIIHPSGGQPSHDTIDSTEIAQETPGVESEATTHGPDSSIKTQPSHESGAHGAMVSKNTSADGSSEFTGPPGTAFIDALISPMDYEINKRFWGWRPNDIIEFTDNINEYQLGVLEVTRRTTQRLTENISRTGSTAAINPYLERAMNALMIRSDRYLFPSCENQYSEAIDNLNKYKNQLINREASFYTRTDNLLPLLQAMEELFGSCDENLVKIHEEDGDFVSTFQADNYYYYAKGAASALLPILVAIEHDFNKVLVTRNATDIMDQAIESCRHASHLSPWLFVTESSLNGIFANHRANMAAHISHARFYLGLMVESLSM